MADQDSFGSVCAIVVTYNIGNAFDTCFNSLKGQVDHVVIVNTSDDDGITRHAIERMRDSTPDRVTLIESPLNNLAFAQNLGIKAALEAGYDWLLLADHDSRLGAGMIAAMEQVYLHDKSRRNIGLLAPFVRTSEPELHAYHQRWWKNPPGKDAAIIEHLFSVPASGSLISSHALTSLTMDESLVIDYVDVDFCLRLRKKGLRIVAVRKATIIRHLGRLEQHFLFGFRITTTNRPALRRYYLFRNRLILWRRYCITFPGFCIYDFGTAIWDLFRIQVWERDKLKKSEYILSGLVDGMLDRTGPKKGISLNRIVS